MKVIFTCPLNILDCNQHHLTYFTFDPDGKVSCLCRRAGLKSFPRDLAIRIGHNMYPSALSATDGEIVSGTSQNRVHSISLSHPSSSSSPPFLLPPPPLFPPPPPLPPPPPPLASSSSSSDHCPAPLLLLLFTLLFFL